MEVKVELNFMENKESDKLDSIYQKSLSNLSSLQEQAHHSESKNLAWYNWPEKAGFELIQQLENDIAHINYYYDLIVVIGIGGSYAGTKAVDDLFGTSLTQNNLQGKCKPVFYLGHNLSENYLLDAIEIIRDFNPIICVVSKSGKTIEPNIAYCVLEEYLISRYSKAEILERTFIMTGEEKSPLLENFDTNKQKIFPIPKDMVGRFSILSSASIVPLTLAGHNTTALMRGAHEFFEHIKEQSQQGSLHTASYASARFLAWEQGKKIELLAYNEPKLQGFSSWWQQLLAESEGKDSKGLFPVASQYSTDLHSLGQYLQEGYPSIFETFLLQEESQTKMNGVEKRLRIPVNERSRSLLGNKCGHYLSDLNTKIMLAAEEAHSSRGVPCCKIKVQRMTEHSLGYLLAFFQTSCVLSSNLLEINPYNQPGVEVYKKELREMF